MALQIITPSTIEPVTVQEVKARLRLTSTVDDATIGTQITVARQFAEKVTKRGLTVQTYALFMDRWPRPCGVIELPMVPLVQLRAIKYLDYAYTVQTWDPAQYHVAFAGTEHPGAIIPLVGYDYPEHATVPGAIEIDFDGGYGPGVPVTAPATPVDGPALPEMIKEGIRQLAMHIYSHPEAVTSEGLKEVPLALMSFFGANKTYKF